MTVIHPLRILASNQLWYYRGAGLLIGTLFGTIIGVAAQTIAALDPPVTITPVVVQVGNYLCRLNDGVRTIERHGRTSNVYTFHCEDGHATFRDTIVDEKERPAP